MSDDGEVGLVAAEVDRRAPEIEDVDQGDDAENENVDDPFVAQSP
jgi:hypothetical protein